MVWKSLCCQAPTRVAGAGLTKWYECEKCGKDCNLAPGAPTPVSKVTFRDALCKSMESVNLMGGAKREEYVDQVLLPIIQEKIRTELEKFVRRSTDGTHVYHDLITGHARQIKCEICDALKNCLGTIEEFKCSECRAPLTTQTRTGLCTVCFARESD